MILFSGVAGKYFGVVEFEIFTPNSILLSIDIHRIHTWYVHISCLNKINANLKIDF